MRTSTRLAVLSSLFFGLACSGLTPKGPWHGDAHFVATLKGDGPTAEADAQVFATRLRELGVTVVVTEVSATELKLEISEARSPEVIPLVLPRYELEIRGAEATLRNEDVEVATQLVGEYSGDPVVDILLTERGAEAFCAMSKASVGQPIDIQVDGVILSSPVVREPICGGKIQIAMGFQSNAGDNLRDARALATALSSAPLASTWTLANLDAR